MRSEAREVYKENLKLTSEQREILVGILLGDANLETENNDKTYRLKIEQSLRHRSYVNHLYEKFQDWVLTPPRVEKVVLNGKIYHKVVFSTVSHKAFRFYAHQYYDAKRKVVPKLIHRWLTPRAMAYWYMDDGSVKSKESKEVVLNTQGFSKQCVNKLCKVLTERMNLIATPRKQKEGFQIYISGESFKILELNLKPFLLKSMLYKFPK